jgi:hypothetical protein
LSIDVGSDKLFFAPSFIFQIISSLLGQPKCQDYLHYPDPKVYRGSVLIYISIFEIPTEDYFKIEIPRMSKLKPRIIIKNQRFKILFYFLQIFKFGIERQICLCPVAIVPENSPNTGVSSVGDWEDPVRQYF